MSGWMDSSLAFKSLRRKAVINFVANTAMTATMVQIIALDRPKLVRLPIKNE
jgi:hypothetical protein